MPGSSHSYSHAVTAFALDPDEFPALTSNMNVIVNGAPERDVFIQGLRTLIAAAQAAVRAT